MFEKVSLRYLPEELSEVRIFFNFKKMGKFWFLTNFSGLLRTIWGKLTSRACWRRFHHRIFGRLGFSHPLNRPLTSYNSCCQYLVQVIKTSNFALTNRSLSVQLHPASLLWRLSGIYSFIVLRWRYSQSLLIHSHRHLYRLYACTSPAQRSALVTSHCTPNCPITTLYDF